MASILIVLHLFLPAATPEPIYAIRPDKSFSHSVEISGPQDRQYYEINIDGPRFYGTIELEGKRTPNASRRVVYDWYKITSPASLQLKSLYYGAGCRLDGAVEPRSVDVNLVVLPVLRARDLHGMRE